jgi:hypothetical protein
LKQLPTRGGVRRGGGGGFVGFGGFGGFVGFVVDDFVFRALRRRRELDLVDQRQVPVVVHDRGHHRAREPRLLDRFVARAALVLVRRARIRRLFDARG